MLKAKIQQDLITAMKAKEQDKVEALRLVVSDIKNKEIDTKQDLSDDDIVKLIRSTIKKLNEAADMFAQGGREDLVQQNRAQAQIYADYVPADLTDAVLTEKVAAIMEQNSSLFAENPKLIMPTVMKELSGQADPQRIIAEIKKHTQ